MLRFIRWQDFVNVIFKPPRRLALLFPLLLPPERSLDSACNLVLQPWLDWTQDFGCDLWHVPPQPHPLPDSMKSEPKFSAPLSNGR